MNSTDPKDQLIELYYRRVITMENRIQELETKLKKNKYAKSNYEC